MAATKAIEFDGIVYGNTVGNRTNPERRYYKLNFRGAIPAGHRVFWCIGSRANFVDVTGGFTRRSLVALSGIYKKLQVWGGEVHTWLEASLAPQAADYLESNPLWLMTPVRPYYGMMTTMGFRMDWTPFTYTKTKIGRLLEYEQYRRVAREIPSPGAPAPSALARFGPASDNTSQETSNSAMGNVVQSMPRNFGSFSSMLP